MHQNINYSASEGHMECRAGREFKAGWLLKITILPENRKMYLNAGGYEQVIENHRLDYQSLECKSVI